MIILLVIIGALPSLLWLWFYLREDCEPEPKSMLAKTFLMGIIVSPLAIVLQLLFIQVFSKLGVQVSMGSPSFFLWAALVEEVIKFYAVKTVALNSREFDEPTDGMIYMITAALGFAMMENILVLNKVIPNGLNLAVNTLILRFFGATLLHTLSSALLGYFLANAWLFDHHHKKLVFFGLGIATVFHFVFNMLIASFDNQIVGLGYSTLLLIIMAFLVYVLFTRVRRRYCAVIV